MLKQVCSTSLPMNLKGLLLLAQTKRRVRLATNISQVVDNCLAKKIVTLFRFQIQAYLRVILFIDQNKRAADISRLMSNSLYETCLVVFIKTNIGNSV